jgi:hypothetical protein
MVRVLFAGIVAGAALFAWGFVSWVVLSWHHMTFRGLTDETALVVELQEQLPKTKAEDGVEVPISGAYMIPGTEDARFRETLAKAKTDDERKKVEAERAAAHAELTERHRDGPIATIFYRHEGHEPMAPQTLAAGLGIAMLCGFFAALAVYIALPGRPNFLLRGGDGFLRRPVDVCHRVELSLPTGRLHAGDVRRQSDRLARGRNRGCADCAAGKGSTSGRLVCRGSLGHRLARFAQISKIAPDPNLKR